ncbi:MAG: hypothetical protein WBD79_08050 [Anaerolineae bacterium]
MREIEQALDARLGKLRAKIPALVEALRGHVREHHRFMLRELLKHLDHLGQCLATASARIAELTAKPGVGSAA